MVFVCFTAARTSLSVPIKHVGGFFYFRAFWLVKYPFNAAVYCCEELRDGVDGKCFSVIFFRFRVFCRIAADEIGKFDIFAESVF